jgi:hypothetical protein
MQIKILIAFAALILALAGFGGAAVSPVTRAYAQGAASRQQDAVQRLKNYYRWIDARKYQGAFDVWEKRGDGSAANGQTFASFKKGFADTRSVAVVVGEPGEIEGAAGSNFIEVPVAVSAVGKSGARQKFVGSYTFRASNVAGDASWYIYAASLKKAK